jgi:hypothetical protein
MLPTSTSARTFYYLCAVLDDASRGSANDPQFVVKDLKEFIRLAGMTHVRTSPSTPLGKGAESIAWLRRTTQLDLSPRMPHVSVTIETSRLIHGEPVLVPEAQASE